MNTQTLFLDTLPAKQAVGGFENQIFQGDCLEVLKTLPENSIDSIVTDPPYELGFMGKSWDNTGIAYNKEMWAECLRVLKPGGHLLAFSGTRTYHRMVVAIEDAGFEVRDMIEWCYGCLSFDTEVLTERGFRRLHKLTQYDRIAVYDTEKNIYKWERPQRWNIYQVNEDTAYRIKSDYTDQIVSRNHRCVVEREGKLIFIQAEELNEVEYMPTLSGDFLTLQKGYWKLLLSDLLWQSKGLAQKVFSKWIGKEVSSKRIEDGKKPSLERWSNLFSQARKLQANKICAVSEAVFADGKKRRLCDGTSFDFSKLNRALPIENGSGASSQSQPAGQPTGKPDVIRIKQGTQITRRARIEKITYSGIIFCPTVSTGAFVARRNGKIFITGNSGFPKSLNIGKVIDKFLKTGNASWNGTGDSSNGALGYSKLQHQQGYRPADYSNKHQDKSEITEDKAKQWEGWGTALKPSHEPICMARKPLSEKSVAENCLKWGTGGINIDESRVEFGDETDSRVGTIDKQTGAMGKAAFGEKTGKDVSISTYKEGGRFPANLIHDNSEEVRECFPESGGGKAKHNSEIIRKGITQDGSSFNTDTCGFDVNKCQGMANFGGSGNASRFFKSIIYKSKASKSERNKGCESIPEQELRGGGGRVEAGYDRNDPEQERLRKAGTAYGAVKAVQSNHHPTVKPIALMEYLIKMVTPKGGIVLDPFTGSGSTLIAAKQNGFCFVGIEREFDYIKIAEARIKAVVSQQVLL